MFHTVHQAFLNIYDAKVLCRELGADVSGAVGLMLEDAAIELESVERLLSLRSHAALEQLDSIITSLDWVVANEGVFLIQLELQRLMASRNVLARYMQ
jgi:hypothetical protein